MVNFFGIHPEAAQSLMESYIKVIQVCTPCFRNWMSYSSIALIGTRAKYKTRAKLPGKGQVTCVYGEPIQVQKKIQQILRTTIFETLTDELMRRIKN